MPPSPLIRNSMRSAYTKRLSAEVQGVACVRIDTNFEFCFLGFSSAACCSVLLCSDPSFTVSKRKLAPRRKRKLFVCTDWYRRYHSVLTARTGLGCQRRLVMGPVRAYTTLTAGVLWCCWLKLCGLPFGSFPTLGTVGTRSTVNLRL